MVKPAELVPLRVVVGKDDWKAIPRGMVYSERERMLIDELKAAGLEEKTPPGMYHFNVIKGKTTEQDKIVLIPIKMR